MLSSNSLAAHAPLGDPSRCSARDRWKPDVNRVWCIIVDVPDGDWGVAGQVTTLRNLVDRFGATLRPERHAEFEFDEQ